MKRRYEYLMMVVFVIVTSSRLMAIEYRLTPMGVRSGYTWSIATGVNNAGQVIGYDYSSNGQRGFLWENGLTRDLGDLIPSGINDNSQIVGSRVWLDGEILLWQNGSASELGVRSYGSPSINNQGQIAYTDARTIQASIWDSEGGDTLSRYYPNSLFSYAYGISDSGDVVGQYVGYDRTIAFKWNNSDFLDLGVGANYACGINNLGEIIGNSTDGQSMHAFIWRSGSAVDLGTLGGSNSFVVRDGGAAINDNGQVVGQAQDASGQSRAFLWQNGNMQDLNGLVDTSGAGWLLTTVYSINDYGVIVGQGTDPAGYQEGFVLTPVPEPSSLLSLVIGGASLIGVAAKRRRS